MIVELIIKKIPLLGLILENILIAPSFIIIAGKGGTGYL